MTETPATQPPAVPAPERPTLLVSRLNDGIRYRDQLVTSPDLVAARLTARSDKDLLRPGLQRRRDVTPMNAAEARSPLAMFVVLHLELEFDMPPGTNIDDVLVGRTVYSTIRTRDPRRTGRYPTRSYALQAELLGSSQAHCDELLKAKASEEDVRMPINSKYYPAVGSSYTDAQLEYLQTVLHCSPEQLTAAQNAGGYEQGVRDRFRRPGRDDVAPGNIVRDGNRILVVDSPGPSTRLVDDMLPVQFQALFELVARWQGTPLGLVSYEVLLNWTSPTTEPTGEAHSVHVIYSPEVINVDWAPEVVNLDWDSPPAETTAQ